jgi:polysaccharide biosynthesis/export protein
VSIGNRGGGMEAAGSRPSRSLAALAVGLALALGGCAAPRACYCHDQPAALEQTKSAYTVACPDTLELVIESHPELAGQTPIRPDGTISLGSIGRLRVEGFTTAEIENRMASVLGMSQSSVQVRIVEFASRQVFLCGPEDGRERATPYLGPEPVVDLLRRTGGLSRQAEPRDVHVVRANVAAGRRPEVFDVNLQAILTGGDASTNIIVQPYDQVYVGETARASWAKCLPPWMLFNSRQPAAASGQ